MLTRATVLRSLRVTARLSGRVVFRACAGASSSCSSLCVQCPSVSIDDCIATDRLARRLTRLAAGTL